MSGDRKNHIQILDGSFGFQIRNHLNVQLDEDPLWSARALKTDSEAVIQTHIDYIKAGSDIIETNTYQASIVGFMKYLNLSRADSYNLIKQAVEYAFVAINRCESGLTKRPLVAGSVGPYGAYLHDGSEYSGHYTDQISEEELIDYHKDRIDALVEAGVDLLAIETIPSQKEAVVLIEYIKKYPNIKAWLSFSCKTDSLETVHGDNYRECVLECFSKNPSQLIAVGVNCIAPHAVEGLLSSVNKDRLTDQIPLIVYANSGETFDAATASWDNKREPLEFYVEKWLDLGVKYIGGCCRVCANYISIIKREVEKWEAKQQ